ncbi:hypothetical protein BDF14DRAFT_1849678 [Spinellus fusiger]|nr:hypothetical protein BDF14DRAFT_1849678 [Spinellus fusiger]
MPVSPTVSILPGASSVLPMDAAFSTQVEPQDPCSCQTSKKHGYHWSQVKDSVRFTNNFHNTAQQLSKFDQLLSIQMQAYESIEAFTCWFQNIRQTAQWKDDERTAALFKHMSQ